MKLVIIIPAFNEASTIYKVITEIPRKIDGVNQVEVVVIDDGSTDGTVMEAKRAGADKIFYHKKNLGLAPSFRRGLEEALKLDADIIVNTDADFQYNQKEIPNIIKPILNNEADLVLTDRQVWKLNHMPLAKKIGNTLATSLTRFISGYKVKDSQSGFRAFSKEAALKLNILSDYTYVQENILQAVYKNLKIIQIPVMFRKREGESRLIGSLGGYAKKSGSFMIRSYIWYKPLKVFLSLGGISFLLGFILGLRYIYFYFLEQSSGHLQSLILATILIVLGFQTTLLGLICDGVTANRRVNEESLYLLKKQFWLKKFK
ncbi:glycosyltransferase family 2 protein [Candidatus Woesearchaeota archaeon]|nr:glycosyltransferase family 2 protein [Candidatus Woesearchaeota archaeon]